MEPAANEHSDGEEEYNEDYIINRVGPEPPDDYYDDDATEQLMDLFDQEQNYGSLVPNFSCEMVEVLVLKRRANPSGMPHFNTVLHAITATAANFHTPEEIRELRRAFRFILSRPYLKLGQFDSDGYLTIHDLVLCFRKQTYMLKLLIDKASEDYLNAYDGDADNAMSPLLLACEVKLSQTQFLARSYF